MAQFTTHKISKEATKDIRELKEKIDRFKNGNIPEERFKAFRLTRGVYGQRQLGVQMFRIKIPYGKITADQLERIADISEEYTNGNLHLTTRQNIQLHFVKLDDTPEMWAKLEELGVTTREACGNTVRNVTASSMAGIDHEEPFDVSPYAEEVFRYFLRNPICQDMGRKVKMAFSSSEKDSAFTYFHDFGFIPKVKNENGKEVRGFRVVVGGGLGAQAMIAQQAFEFLPEDQVVPFIEAGLRVFDRYGEREKRFKARLKFLIDEKKGIGLQGFLKLVEKERAAIGNKSFRVDRTLGPETTIPGKKDVPWADIGDEGKYAQWVTGNVLEQKQKGFYAVRIKLPLGNLSADQARAVSSLVRLYAADDIRITINQGLMLKFVRKGALPYIYHVLSELGLSEAGFDTLADITACPGTDTCNLGVTNSTGIAEVLEHQIREEFPELILDTNLHIKISGCMNACGQHMAANIGLHGSSIKNGKLVIPAMQVVIGGGVGPNGQGFIADKVIKLPTKKIPEALRFLLNDYEENGGEGEYFNDYYQRFGKMYFYKLLKPLADINKLVPSDYTDWGHSGPFVPEIGTGECAGVTLDVVGTIIQDAEEKLQYAFEAYDEQLYADAIYHSYSVFVVGAKALLLGKDISCNTQINIIKDFNQHFVESGDFPLDEDFETLVLQINKNEPGKGFAHHYLSQAKLFMDKVLEERKQQIESDKNEEHKLVVNNYYKA